MARVIRGFPSGIVACYDEPNLSGAADDINAPRNAPARDPTANLTYVVWHSNFYQFELVVPEQVVNVSHPAVPSLRRYIGIRDQLTPISPPAGVQISVYGDDRIASHTLYTHNLGYTPSVFASFDGHMLGAGEVVQTESGGRSRKVALYANGAIIGLREVGRSSDVELPAVTRTYRLLICRTPAADPNLPLFSGPSPVQLARGKIGSGRRMLRTAGQGSSSYALNLNRTMDLRNGRVRFATGGAIISEDGYNGTFAGSPYKTVGS